MPYRTPNLQHTQHYSYMRNLEVTQNVEYDPLKNLFEHGLRDGTGKYLTTPPQL